MRGSWVVSKRVPVWFPDLAVPATQLETLLLHTTDHCSAPLAPAGVPWLHSPQRPPPNPITVPVCLSLSTKGPDPEAPPTQDTEGQGKIHLGG